MTAAEQRWDTSERILEGALHAVGRRGVQKLSMNDVSESAAVSRSTLYRYFPSKEELLAALVRYEQQRYELSLRGAVGRRVGDERLTATVDHAFAYLRDHPTLERVLEVEPGFVLGYIREHVPGMRRATAVLLRDVLEQSPLVGAGVADVEQLADVVIRLLVANFLAPGDHPEADAQLVKDVLRTLVIGPSGG